jgi:hypothetical protein
VGQASSEAHAHQLVMEQNHTMQVQMERERASVHQHGESKDDVIMTIDTLTLVDLITTLADLAEILI